MNNEQFFTALASYAQAMQRRTGIPASVALAQAALESGFGKSLLAREGKNLFGVKAGRSWGGDTLSLPTTEYINGTPVRQVARWRKYANWEESFTDLARVYYNGLYEEALSWRQQPVEFITRAARVYATDPNYARKVITLIERYNLTRYDLPVHQWQLDPKIVPKRHRV